MPKYIIKWDGGYGESIDIVEAVNHTEAVDMAYQNAKEEAESSMNYNAELFDPDNEDHQELNDEQAGKTQSFQRLNRRPAYAGQALTH